MIPTAQQTAAGDFRQARGPRTPQATAPTGLQSLGTSASGVQGFFNDTSGQANAPMLNSLTTFMGQQPQAAPTQQRERAAAQMGMQSGGAPATSGMMMGGPTPGNFGPLGGNADGLRQPGFPNQNPTGTTGQPWGAPGAQLQAFGPGNDMRGMSILPSDSASTQTATGYRDNAAAGLNNFQFGQFQGMQPLDFTNERGMLSGANAQMQGLNFDFTGANAQYGNAVSAQQGAAGQAGSMLQGLASGGMNFGGGGAARADTGRFNQELDAALAGLEGPDRAALAAQTLGLLEERTQPGFEMAQRQTGQRAAALGRLGSGMTTNDLTGVLQDRERMLDQSRRELATNAAGQTLNDRLAISGAQSSIAGQRFGGETFNAGLADNAAGRAQQGAMFGANLQRGIAGDLYGMGRDAAGLQMDIGDRFGSQARDRVGLGERQAGFSRDTANDFAGLTRDTYMAGRDERDTARRDEYSQFDTSRQRLNDFSNLLSGERQNDFGNRQELRGEREFQDGQARTARQDAIDQQMFNEYFRNSAWGRANQAGGLGFNNSPTNAIFGAASNARSNAFG
jgi:hypothetical protein